MNDKICMVTGANSGIGFVTASALAERGATVIMVCRNEDRGKEALRRVRANSGNDRVELLLADLSVGSSIRNLIEMFRTMHTELHVLVNNAGGIFTDRSVTSEGMELTFALNHMGAFRLTTGLLDVITGSAPARIVNVSSDAHRFSPFDFDDLQSASGKFRGFRAYAQSKLANILFTVELARRLEGTGVTVNAVHPGMVRTNFGKGNQKTVGSLIFGLVSAMFSVDAEKGATTSVHLATSADVENVTGGYFADCRQVAPSKAALDLEAARRLWDISAELTREAS